MKVYRRIAVQLPLFAAGISLASTIACTPGSLDGLIDDSPSPDVSSPTPEDTPTPSATPTATPLLITPTPTPTNPPEPTDEDGDGAFTPEDCNDDDASVFPGASETCDEKDNDCDGEIDDGFVKSTYYADEDGDTYGNIASSSAFCEQPEGWTLTAGDCDDSNHLIYPDAPELCNGIDDNCNSTIDEGKTELYPDEDGDGFGDMNAETVEACLEDPNVSAVNTDCDDGNATTYPGAIEYCDGLDHNCNGNVSSDAVSYAPDADQDGYGDETAELVIACEPIAGSVDNALDCADGDANLHPLWVDVTTGTEGGTGTYADPISSIQRSLVVGNDCGLILVGPGNYSGFFSVDGRKTPLEIKGLNGATATTLAASSATRPVTISGSSGIHLNGFTVSSAFTGGQNGGCVSIVNSSSIALTDLVVNGCKVDVNTQLKGGGINIESSSAVSLKQVRVANSKAHVGGGVHVKDSSVEIDASEFTSNTAESSGGGVQAEQSGSPSISTQVSILFSRFASNIANDYGGGGSAEGFVTLEVEDSYFEGNIAGATYGGGLHNPSRVIRSTFIANKATGTGLSSDGGAITVRQASFVSNCIFMGNEAQFAGAVTTYEYSNDQHADYAFYNNTFVDNNARSSFTPGDTFYFYQGDSLEFFNNILIDIDGDNSELFRTYDPSFEWDIGYNFFFASSGSMIAGINAGITEESIINKNGNITDDVIAEPIFKTYTSGQYAKADLHLLPGAVCVNAGDPSLPADLDGTVSDMGAYGGPEAAP